VPATTASTPGAPSDSSACASGSTGHRRRTLTVDPEQRESYLAGCMSVVEKARRADGCLDFAITADLLDPGRVNLFERWETQAALDTFRRSAPRNKQRAAMRSVSVGEYDIADVRPLFGKGRT
jgi:quinol monooxygenase YgiN